jgi:integrase
MKRRGFVESNPWEGQGDYSKKRRLSGKRPFKSAEITRLLRADPVQVLGGRYGGAVADLQRLGLMTGARLNELCELRAEDVQPDHCAIRIKNGKTANAARTIPVHLSVWPIIEKRLHAASEAEGQLFPGLEPQGPDQKRSWYVSKRFTAYRRAVLGDSDEVDFHSFRRCFATYLERAQSISGAVYPSVIDELMGHKKQTLALSLYSGGLRRDHLQAAIRAMAEAIEPEVLDAVGMEIVDALGLSQP